MRLVTTKDWFARDRMMTHLAVIAQGCARPRAGHRTGVPDAPHARGTKRIVSSRGEEGATCSLGDLEGAERTIRRSLLEVVPVDGH